jgi:hypothetical protein
VRRRRNSTGARSARRCVRSDRAAYFELDEPELELGDVAEPEPVADPEPLTEPEPDVVVSVDERGVEVEGEVAVGGEADGVRSAGRSLVRVVLVSVHPVASVAISASAEIPASVRFMKRTLL